MKYYDEEVNVNVLEFTRSDHDVASVEQICELIDSWYINNERYMYLVAR